MRILEQYLKNPSWRWTLARIGSGMLIGLLFSRLMKVA